MNILVWFIIIVFGLNIYCFSCGPVRRYWLYYLGCIFMKLFWVLLYSLSDVVRHMILTGLQSDGAHITVERVKRKCLVFHRFFVLVLLSSSRAVINSQRRIRAFVMYGLYE